MSFLNEPLTFESLRFNVGVLADIKPDLPPTDGTIVTLRDGPAIDQLKLASLNVELNNLYTAVYWPTRQFASEAVQLRQMSDALRWLLGNQPNILGVTAEDALALVALSAFDLSDLLLEQFERSDTDMQRLYGANVRALLVIDKLGTPVSLMGTEADTLVGSLELVAAVNKPMSKRDAVVMDESDLTLARALLAESITCNPDLETAYATLKRRLLLQKDLLERHAQTPPSRLQAAAAEAQAILLGL